LIAFGLSRGKKDRRLVFPLSCFALNECKAALETYIFNNKSSSAAFSPLSLRRATHLHMGCLPFVTTVFKFDMHMRCPVGI